MRKQRIYSVLKLCLAACAIGYAGTSPAADISTLDPVQVIESRENLMGIADSANQGVVTRAQLESRPTYRSGELVEVVPGLIVGQHSGDGKANQYFLRGFNLDHGTDFAISVDGVPVNLRTHAHAQGYSDLNFLIPELVSGLNYRKGPYYADEGDFSAAGATQIQLRSKFDGAMVAAGRRHRILTRPFQ